MSCLGFLLLGDKSLVYKWIERLLLLLLLLWKVNQLLFVDDTALVVDMEEKLCRLLEEFVRVWRRRNVKRRLYEGVLTALYGVKHGVWQ